MTIELLITIQKENTFASDKEGILKLVTSDKNISIENENTFIFNSKNEQIKIRFKIKEDFFKISKHRYFEFFLKCDDDTKKDQLNTFSNILKTILEKIDKYNIKIQVLHNDVESFYSIQGYPLVYYTENLMRKLINKFMLRHIGDNWFNQNINPQIKDKIKSKGIDKYKSELHEIDFISLTDFVLFKPYRDLNINKLNQYIETLEEDSNVDVKKLKMGLPKSNWDRYFSTLVDESQDSLKVKWEKLYKIRNLIAHNVGLKKNQFIELKKITEELNPKLELAIEKIDQVYITEGGVKSFAGLLSKEMEKNPKIGIIFLALILLGYFSDPKAWEK